MESPLQQIEAAQVPLLRSLISRHPVYGSAGQRDCADMIHDTLEQNGWDRVITDTYTSRSIINEPDYVKVEEFGDGYQGDLERPKYNVYGVVDGKPGGPTVILNGHYDVDVVSDPELWDQPFDWKLARTDGSRVIGRGATDMLGGLTSLISVGSYFAARKDQWHGRIVLAAVTDEEIGGNGTVRSFTEFDRLGYLDDGQAGGLVGLIAEPSDGIAAVESLGFMHMKLSASRQSRHMGTASQRHNALYDMMAVIQGFDTILDAAAADQNLSTLPKLIHNFGIISGGKDAAIPIGHVSSEATIFYPATVNREGLEQSIARQILARHGDVVDIGFSDFGFRGHKSAAGRMAEALLTTAGTGFAGTGTFNSPCDARIFETYGVGDVCIYGPGSLSRAHSINEFIHLDDLRNYNRHIVDALAGLLVK